MKIIDRYILTRFCINFFITFTVLMFIFFFHTIWLFIQELAGKNIGVVNILKFLLYYTPSLTYITLPLAVVVSSIMTFGSLAENYEFVAIKSSGISLNRAMRSLTVFMVFLSIGAFFIANNLIPMAEYKNYKFKYSISRAKPSLAITAGVFSDMGAFNIKVDRKYGPDDRLLENVIIHKTDENEVNNILITSKTGEIISVEENNFVKLILHDGYYYEDVKENKDKSRYSHAKSKFETYVFNIDLSYLNSDKFDKSKMVNTFQMMTFTRLSKAIDSLRDNFNNDIKVFEADIYRRTHISQINRGFNNLAVPNQYDTRLSLDSLIIEMSNHQREQCFKSAMSNSESILRILDAKAVDMKARKRAINKYMISYHDKFSLAFACLILFFTGAPLGAIIRKGGIGLPMVVAIVLFLSYYFIGLLAKNIGENGGINPVLSSWLSNIIILPIGIVFINRVASDRRLLRTDKLFRWLYGIKDALFNQLKK